VGYTASNGGKITNVKLEVTQKNCHGICKTLPHVCTGRTGKNHEKSVKAVISGPKLGLYTSRIQSRGYSVHPATFGELFKAETRLNNI
jgi:hypothetical protein